MEQIVAFRAAGGTILMVEQNARAALGIARSRLRPGERPHHRRRRGRELLDEPKRCRMPISAARAAAPRLEERIRGKRRAILGR